MIADAGPPRELPRARAIAALAVMAPLLNRQAAGVAGLAPWRSSAERRCCAVLNETFRPNEIWIGDVLVGPFVPHPRIEGSRRARLFAFLDDHSRLLVHGA